VTGQAPSGVGAAAVEDTFRGANGLRIFWRAWLPEGDPVAIVAIVHGVSEHSGRYAHVAADLVGHGYAVYALDHRGHGLSEGDRCVIDRLEHAVSDIDSLISIARDRHPDTKVFVLGHSLGGCLSLAHSLRHQDELDGLILSAPVAVLESASAAMRAVARLLSSVVPRLGVYDVDTEAISTDPRVVADYREDPLVYHRKVPVRTLAEATAEIETFPDRLPSLKLPLLALHGAADTIVPPAASRLVEERAGSTKKQLVIYPGLRHEILNEPERQTVLADIRGWLAEVR
jgi:acylglycerol lipase